MFSSISLKTLRQIFKACSDDTRLRIICLLAAKELTVKEICISLRTSQPTISKHLTRLRLLKIVLDRREGNLVYYRLNRNLDSPQGEITAFIISKFSETKTFKKDKEAMQKVGEELAINLHKV